MVIEKGPYLQSVQTDSITVCWQTAQPVSGAVWAAEAAFPQVPAEPHPTASPGAVFHGPVTELHRICITGLRAGTDYVYQILTPDGAPATERLTFRTAPEEEDAFTFAITSEYGGVGKPDNPFASAIRQLIALEHPEFLLSLGDIVADGTREQDWDDYLFKPYARLLTNTPFFPCIGNHEVNCNAVPEGDTSPYRWYDRYFTVPHYYAFDYGCAHFCVLDAPALCRQLSDGLPEGETYGVELKQNASEQLHFLEQDLAATDKKWKFVLCHYPPYTSAIFTVRALRCLAPILERYGVDIMFNSHAIVYERSHPIRNGKTAKDGVRYILTGGHERFDRLFWDKPRSTTAKLSGNRPNYLRVALSPYRLELQAIDYEGKLFDQLVLEKD